MSGLYEPSRHEPLAEVAWDASAVRAAIGRIVEDARRSFTSGGLWPIHPDDGPPEWGALTGLYFGAAGVIWALDYLQRQGAASEGATFAEHLPDIEARNARFVAAFGDMAAGYLLGETGVLLVRWRLTGELAVLDRLAELIEANVQVPARELMWGAPGTMLVALSLHQDTGEPRWASMFRTAAAALRATFERDEWLHARIWTQDLYGLRLRYLGAVHGFAGNAYALWRGRELLQSDEWGHWAREIARTLDATAIREGGLANWPPQVGEPAEVRHGALLVQHCHGSPGIVNCLAGFEGDVEKLLRAGGELIWRAGPLTKGANLCHGTAGNGYAFLKLFERTGEDLWLGRARAFAMHAIAQSETLATELGRRRYSLWTGDLGLACYLWDSGAGRVSRRLMCSSGAIQVDDRMRVSFRSSLLVDLENLG